MTDRPRSLVEADSIVANWANAPPSSAVEHQEALLDCLTPLLEKEPTKLRESLQQGDPRAFGAMAALRARAPALISEMVALLTEIAGRGDSQGTLDRLPTLEAIARAIDDSAALGQAEYLRGYTFRRLGQNFRAIEAYQRALAHGGDAAFRSRTLDRLGNVQCDVSAFDEATASYQAALKVETDPAGKAAILRNVAGAMRSLGEFSIAEDAERQAAVVSQAAAKDGYALDAAAQSFSTLGDHAWALELNDRAKTWFEGNNPVALPVNAEIRIALLQRAGRPQDAEAQFRKALALFDAQAQATINPQHYIEGWRRSYGTRLSPKSPLMMNFGLAVRSGNVTAIEQVVASARQAGDIALTLRARAVIGGLLFERGRLDEAAAGLEDVLSEAGERGLAQPQVSALLTLASIAQSGGPVRRSAAQVLCRARQLRALMISYLDSSDLAPIERQIELNDTGAIENQLGQYATALEIWTCAAEFFDRAAQRSDALGDDGRLANRLAGLRRAASRANDTKRAESAATRLRSLLETKSLPDNGRLVAARALAAHDRTNDPAAAERYIEVAVQAGERIRAAAPPGQRDNVDLQWNDVYWTLAEARRAQGRDKEAFAAVQLGKFRGFAETVGARAGIKILPPSLAEIQSRLRPDEALVDIASENAALGLYLVRRDGFEAFAIPGDLDQLLKPDTGDMRDRAAAQLVLARGDAILAGAAAQIEARLPESARLFLAPPPALGNLPWHAIQVGARAWCERRPISILPAASALLAPRRAREKKVLVIGDSRDDLPQARAESATVAALYGTRAYVGRECSVETLMAALTAGPLDIIHIATHGRGNPRQGGLSSLLLADAAGVARWTAMEEITRVPWDVGLVVLSGCSTGLIGRRNGGQMVSVAESVLRAGARAVVACLWPVGDAAARTGMETFHRVFSSMPDVGTALEASRTALKAPDAVLSPLRDGRGQQPAGSTARERELNWSAFLWLGVSDPFS